MSVDAPQRPADLFPDRDEYLELLEKRTRRGTLVRLGFLSLLIMAILALATLLLTIIDDSFGLVAMVNEQEPEAVVSGLGYDPAVVSLDSLSKEDLLTVLQGSINNNVGRRLERDQRFFDDRLVFESQAKWDEICASDEPPAGCTASVRDRQNVYLLVLERVIKPDIIDSYGLFPSLFAGAAFEDEVETAFRETPERYPDYTFDQVQFEWRAWLNRSFLTSPSSSIPELAGIRTAILGSAWIS